MVIVIQAFRERYHHMKLYNVGDEYPAEDSERVHYLIQQGFLEVQESEMKTGEGSVDPVAPTDPTDPEEETTDKTTPEKAKRSGKKVTADDDSNA